MIFTFLKIMYYLLKLAWLLFSHFEFRTTVDTPKLLKKKIGLSEYGIQNRCCYSKKKVFTMHAEIKFSKKIEAYR